MSADHSVNLHGVWMTGGLLGVHCLHCGHRTVLNSKRTKIIRKDNPTPLRVLKLRCRECGVIGAGKDMWQMCTPFDREEADRFLAGQDIGRTVVL
jgi:hypothetical protein